MVEPKSFNLERFSIGDAEVHIGKYNYWYIDRKHVPLVIIKKKAKEFVNRMLKTKKLNLTQALKADTKYLGMDVATVTRFITYFFSMDHLDLTRDDDCLITDIMGECPICGETFSKHHTQQITCGKKKCDKAYARVRCRLIRILK